MMKKVFQIPCGTELHRVQVDTRRRVGKNVILLDHDLAAEHVAVQLGAERPACVQLADAVADGGFQLESFFLYALSTSNVAVTAVLLAVGACDIEQRNTSFETPVMTAARYGSPEMVQLLMAHGADVHADCEKPLDLAARRGDVTVLLELLLGANADLKVVDALSWAAALDKADAVKFILDTGAYDVATVSAERKRVRLKPLAASVASAMDAWLEKQAR